MYETDYEYDVLDKIISEMRPVCIPAELVASAKITLEDGSVFTVGPEELEDVMNDDDKFDDLMITDISFVLDFEKFKETILDLERKILRSYNL